MKNDIPNTITVSDVAEIMGVSQIEVREWCKNGTLKSKETLSGSGRYRIETKQLMNKGNWEGFLGKRKKIKEHTIRIAEFILQEY